MNHKILVIGGTQMIGRNFVEFLISNYDGEVFIANRGKTNPDLFRNTKVQHIYIDRNSEISCEKLKEHQFGIVIDFSCYNKQQLQSILNHIIYQRYYLISTTCVKSEEVLSNIKHWLYEYCVGKKQIEEHIISNKIKNLSIVRPCIIFGKNDYSGRFYEKENKVYWIDTNKLVASDKYHISVDEFTISLWSYITNYSDSITIVEINGDGIEIIHDNSMTRNIYDIKA